MTTSLSSVQSLGYRFIVEPQGPVLSAEEKKLLSDLKPLGVMFRRRNFVQDVPYSEWFDAYKRLVAEIQVAIGRPKVVFCIDHEGGNVHRFPPPITRFPYAMKYGSSVDTVRAVSRAMAIELASLGINLTFSPVADVHSNPQNPVIHQRSFSTEPCEVAAAAVASAQEFRLGGVLPCAKHFPGHGDTAVDSHVALPVVKRDKESLRSCELVPFKALIDSGVEMVMTAHLIVSRLDPSNQATVSPVIIDQLLREELGFNGVTIADALGMKAIVDDLRSHTFASRAHMAGLDVFLVVGDVVSIEDALLLRDELRHGIQSRSLTEASMQGSIARISTLLQSIKVNRMEPLCEETLKRHQLLSDEIFRQNSESTFNFSPKGFE
jgi:beta-N-acetylhexosaminidase